MRPNPWLGLACVLLLWGCQPGTPDNRSATPKPKREAKQHLVEIQSVSLNTQRTQHRYTGTVEAHLKTRIYNQEEGRIAFLAVDSGDHVRRQQVLLRMDEKQLQAELKKTQAHQDKADADLQRILEMHKVKLASDVERMQAETALKVTIAEQHIVTLRVRNTTIRAPFSGIVLEKLVEQGNVIPKYTHLLTLIDPKQLFVQLSVSEFLLPALQVGDRPDIMIMSNRQHVQGTLRKILPQIDPITKQGSIEIDIPNMAPALVVGQSVQVTLSTPALARLTIPFSALQRDHDSAYVYLFDANKAHKRLVQPGAFIGNAVVVLSGLALDERVITKGFTGLKPGKTVHLPTPTVR